MLQLVVVAGSLRVDLQFMFERIDVIVDCHARVIILFLIVTVHHAV